MPRTSMLGRRGNAEMPIPQPFFVPDSASRSSGNKIHQKSMLGRRGNAKMPIPQPIPDSASRSVGRFGTGQKRPRKSMLGRRGNAKMPETLLVSVLASRHGPGKSRQKDKGNTRQKHPERKFIPPIKRCLLLSLNEDSVVSKRNSQGYGDNRKQQVHPENLLSRFQIPSSGKENNGTTFEFTASRSNSGRKIGTPAVENRPRTPYMSPKAPLLRQSKSSRRVLNFVDHNEVNIESGNSFCLPESSGNGYISAPKLKRSAKSERHVLLSSQSTLQNDNVNVVHPQKKFKLNDNPGGTQGTLTSDKSQFNENGLHVQEMQAISSEKANLKSKIPQLRMNYSSEKTQASGARCQTESETKKLAATSEISENLSSSHKKLNQFKTLGLVHTKTDKTDAFVIDEMEASTSGACVFTALPQCVNSPTSSTLNLGSKGKSAKLHGNRFMYNSTDKKRKSRTSEGVSVDELQMDDLGKYFKIDKPGEMKSADKYSQSHVKNSECIASVLLQNDIRVQNIPPLSEITNEVQSETSMCTQNNNALLAAKDSADTHSQIVIDDLCSSKTKSFPNNAVICHNSSSTSNVQGTKTNHFVHSSAQLVPTHEPANSASTQTNFTPLHDNTSYILGINKVLELLEKQKQIDNEIEILKRKSNDIYVEIVNTVSMLGRKNISDTREHSVRDSNDTKINSVRRSARIAAITSGVMDKSNVKNASSTPFPDESIITPNKSKSGNLSKSSAMYKELRQNFKFLKTPKNTPSRTLSRSIHKQLMSLYD